MPRLFGAQRMVLQAILDAQGETSAFIEDTRVAQVNQISLRDMRDWFLTLDQDEYVDLALTESGLKALGHRQRPPGSWALPTVPDATQPSPRTVQVSQPDGPRACPGHRHQRLPASDSEAACRRQRRARDGQAAQFGPGPVPLPERSHASPTGKRPARPSWMAIEATFSGVQADDAVFAYLAGHGEVVAGEYYFIAHDTTAQGIATNGVPLKRIKAAFDSSPSQRAFLWLDFCHSGGIIPRDFGTEPDDREVISRALEVVQGQGKLIIAACTPVKKA